MACHSNSMTIIPGILIKTRQYATRKNRLTFSHIITTTLHLQLIFAHHFGHWLLHHIPQSVVHSIHSFIQFNHYKANLNHRTSRRHYYILFFNHWSDNAKNHTFQFITNEKRNRDKKQIITVIIRRHEDQWQLENTNGSHLCFHDRTFFLFFCFVYSTWSSSKRWGQWVFEWGGFRFQFQIPNSFIRVNEWMNGSDWIGLDWNHHIKHRITSHQNKSWHKN